MKRLFPAIALLFVVAFSSFTTAPVEDEQGTVYRKTATGWELTDEDYLSNCPSGTIVCAVDVISGNHTLAQNAAASTTFPAGTAVTITNFDPNVEGESAIVYPRTTNP